MLERVLQSIIIITVIKFNSKKQKDAAKKINYMIKKIIIKRKQNSI